ncbi:MAG: VWA domain-containing protein [Bacteroidetes bacterium]|nr:VWA domain-containing protein [Bacteroidota bacterium]
MFHLENKYMLYAFVIIPFLVLGYWYIVRKRKKALSAFGEQRIIDILLPDVSETKRAFKGIFYVVAFMFLIYGMANPQVGTKLEEVKRKGADLMICLDVSNSMKAEDLQPNRLERSKQSLSKLIDGLEGDRIGIIVFGGQAYVQLPITTDYAAAKLFLESINTDMVPTQGTAIGKAIDLALESFGKDEGKNKAIVIITDGENHEDDAIRAAEAAAEKGISIHTIGMGSENGAPIPVYKNGIQDGFRKDKEGNTVVTKLNEPMLQQLAAAGSGVYVRATNSDAGLKNVLDAIDKLEKKQFESKMYSDYEDRFQWFIAIAFVLLLIETLLTERKSKLYQRLNLFGDKDDK